MRAHVLFLFIAATLCAQERFTIGGKLGVPFTDPLGSSSESRAYAVGPSVEFRLPAGFAVEASGIYHRIGKTYWFNFSAPVDPPALVINRTRGNSWEFPVIGKYYLRGRQSRWAPYFGAGLAFRRVDFQSVESTITSGTNLSSLVSTNDQRSTSGWKTGPTAAAGVRLRVGRFAFSPEVRYTRWGSQGILNQKNEAGLFLGFAF
jgi:opacity protein-like surface antigen